MENISTATEQELIEAWKSRDKRSSLLTEHYSNVKDRLLTLRGLEVTRFNSKVKTTPTKYYNYFYGKILGTNDLYKQESKQIKDKWKAIGLPFDEKSLEEKWLGSGYHAGGVL